VLETGGAFGMESKVQIDVSLHLPIQDIRGIDWAFVGNVK